MLVTPVLYGLPEVVFGCCITSLISGRYSLINVFKSINSLSKSKSLSVLSFTLVLFSVRIPAYNACLEIISTFAVYTNPSCVLKEYLVTIPVTHP